MTWMTLKQVAAYTRLSEPTLRRAARKGLLRCVKVAEGRIYRFQLAAVEEFMNRLPFPPRPPRSEEPGTRGER